MSAAKSRDGIALAAVGGYGRGELSPGSDLDILLLHNGQLSPDALLTFVNAMLYPIWDGTTSNPNIPRSVDHSVRTRSETREAAREDIKVAMGLLDIRFICGDVNLVAAVQHDAIDDWRKDSRKRLPQLREGLTSRHARAGELAYLLEPDLKEARGGLRDITALRAIALSGAVDVSLDRISKAESILGNIREALHAHSGKSRDRLLFQEQDKVALDMGYADADALMSDVAQSARDVDYLMELTCHRLDHRGKDGLGRILRRPRTTSLARGISVAHQEVVIDVDAFSSNDPVLGLRAAANAAQIGLPLSLDSCVELARSPSGVLPNPWPRQAREDLVALIGAGSAMVKVWEALDQEGLITTWLPEWATVRSLPQRNVLHRHTVDRHMVETAVQHHLLLSATATRRDLDDPATIASVLAVIPDIDTLELLHALSIADGEATGSAAWSTWKATLVADLVARTRAAMTGSTLAQQPELDAQQRGFAEVGALRVEVSVRESDYAIEIIAPDKPGLLSIVAGVLNLARLDVRSARTRSHGISAVMEWIVNLDPHAPIPTAEKLHQDLDMALRGQSDLERRIQERVDTYSKRPTIPVPAPEVEAFTSASADATVFEVRSHDMPGLLFRIGDAVTRCRVDIRSAIVTTLGAEAIDTLYVTEIAGGPLTRQRADEVADRLREMLR